MGSGIAFECEVTASTGVEDKLRKKHKIEVWEIEEVIYDDPFAFSLRHQDVYFVYGQSENPLLKALFSVSILAQLAGIPFRGELIEMPQ